MSDNAYNSTDTLKGRLSFLAQPDQWDLADILESANREAKSEVGRFVEERLKPDTEDQRTFRLSFAELIPLSDTQDVRVQLYDQEVDPSNYTINTIKSGELLEGEITFDESWASDKLKGFYRLTIEYIPADIKDLELTFAIIQVLRLSTVQTNDEEEANRLDQMKEARDDLVRKINNRMPIPDRDRGQSLGANRRRHNYR